jgi:predicted nucleic acid-binding Zn ribbon protein
MARGPQPIGSVLADLMARRGFARVRAAEAYEAAWREAAGPLLAGHSRLGALKAGKLDVIVANSALMQELTFQKAELLGTLQRLLPDEGIRDLRIRAGAL